MYQNGIAISLRYDDPPAYDDLIDYPHLYEQESSKSNRTDKSMDEVDVPIRPLPSVPKIPNTFEIASKKIMVRKKSYTKASKSDDRARRLVPPYQRKTGLGIKLCFMLLVTFLCGIMFGIYCFINKKLIFKE